MDDFIVDDLVGGIIKGRFAPEEPLPSETVLCHRYQVSRITVRRAYRQLEARGYVRSLRGKGHFLVPPKRQIPLELRSKRGFTEKMTAAGLELRTVNLGLRAEVKTNRKIRSALNADPPVEIYSLSLLRIIDRQPAALHSYYFRSEGLNDIDECGNEISSMYAYLSDKGFGGFESRGFVLSATLPTHNERDALECPALVPLILAEYETHVDGLGAVLYNKIVYRGDLFKLMVLD